MDEAYVAAAQRAMQREAVGALSALREARAQGRCMASQQVPDDVWCWAFVVATLHAEVGPVQDIRASAEQLQESAELVPREAFITALMESLAFLSGL